MFRRNLITLVLTFFTMGAAWAAGPLPWQAKTDFLDASQVFTLSATQLQGDHVVAAGHVADGYYVYRKSLRLDDARGTAVDVTL